VGRPQNALRKVSQYGIIVFLLLLCAYFTWRTGGLFATPNNLVNVSRQIAINMIVAVGLTFVIISGGIDLSVGSVVALAGVISMSILRDGFTVHTATIIPILPMLFAIPLSGIIGALIGGGLGIFNGFVITRFRVAPFIATLAMMTIARGFAFVYTDGQPISPLPEAVGLFGAGEHGIGPFVIPNLVVAALIVVALGHVLLTRTRFGRYVYAIGGNEEAARLSGISVSRAKLKIYALCGMLAGVCGMLLATRLASGDPKSGDLLELNAIAAVVLGGTSLSGGRGTVIGTLVGALVIGVLNNGLSLLNVSPYYQWVVKGAVILGAVILDQLTRGED